VDEQLDDQTLSTVSTDKKLSSGFLYSLREYCAQLTPKMLSVEYLTTRIQFYPTTENDIIYKDKRSLVETVL
jgi:hypothetical protein